ncbi:hypothetical protein B0H13DRAFT_2684920 [Mycena leptocephala]|nr:hypothetical protein B0H13DRAFT_2684920 [Mycena leptocephala]
MKDGNWVKMMQDMDTTTWQKEIIKVPVLDQVEKQRVYYIEVTFQDEDRMPAAGVLYELSCTQLVTIVVNGYTVAICITIPTNSLAVPTLELWTKGMDAKKILDIHPMERFQKKFAEITMQDLKAAKDRTNPDSGPIITATDAQLTKLATELHALMGVLSRPGPPLSATERIPPHDASADGDMLVLSDIARLRSTDEPSLGYITGGRATADRFRIHDVAASSSMLDSYAADPPASEKLNISWSDLILGIKKGIYTVQSFNVDKVQDGIVTVQDDNDTVQGGVDIILSLSSKVGEGLNYVWNGILSLARQVFEVAESLFTALGCAFEKLFGWLCYLFDWDDIKATAKIFKNYMSGFEDLATDWIDNVLPLATNDFFDKCKTTLDGAVGAAKKEIGDEKVGKYDTADNTLQKEFDGLPCSVMWLHSKFLDAEGIYGGLESAISGLYSDELKTAASQFMTLLGTFVLRRDADNVTFSALLDAVKPVINELLKNVYGLVSQIANIAKKALSTIGDLLKAELIENAVCYSLAIPFTVLHNIITGVSPAETGELTADSMNTFGGVAAKKKKRSPLLWRALMALLSTPGDITIDTLGVTGAHRTLNIASGAFGFGQIAMKLINCSSLVLGILNWTLMDPAKMIRGSPREMFAISIPAILHIFTGTWYGLEGFLKGPRGDFIGQIVLGVGGVCSFLVGAYYWIDSNVQPKVPELGIAGLLRSLSLCGKFLRLAPKAAMPKVLIAIVVIDAASGYGTAAARFAAYLRLDANMLQELGPN